MNSCKQQVLNLCSITPHWPNSIGSLSEVSEVLSVRAVGQEFVSNKIPS